MTTTENSSSSAVLSAAVNATESQKAESDLENLRTLYRELCTSYRAIDDRNGPQKLDSGLSDKTALL